MSEFFCMILTLGVIIFVIVAFVLSIWANEFNVKERQAKYEAKKAELKAELPSQPTAFIKFIVEHEGSHPRTSKAFEASIGTEPTIVTIGYRHLIERAPVIEPAKYEAEYELRNSYARGYFTDEHGVTVPVDKILLAWVEEV